MNSFDPQLNMLLVMYAMAELRSGVMNQKVNALTAEPNGRNQKAMHHA